jgi:hypothetical protein
LVVQNQNIAKKICVISDFSAHLRSHPPYAHHKSMFKLRTTTLLALALASVLRAQVTTVTDTVRLCTGEQYLGVVFGRDSLLAIDTSANGDSIRAVQVLTLPVYLNIRDTHIVRGSWFMGEQRFVNTSVNEFGQTYLGCDSNTTWVLFFGKNDEPDPPTERLRWTAKVFPTVHIVGPVCIELSAQTEAQAKGKRANIQRFDPLGRFFPVEYDPVMEQWARDGNTFRLTLETRQWVAGVHYILVEVVGQLFVFEVVILR